MRSAAVPPLCENDRAMDLQGVISPPISLHTLLTGWQTDWLSVAALTVDVALAAWYCSATVRLGRKGRRWSPWRTGSFLAGIATIVCATESGLASYDSSVFMIHVVQHLLLMNVAPIFLMLGAPVTLALQSSNRRTQQTILKVLHHPVVELITHPLVVLALYSGTMIVYFLTPFYQLSLEHPLLHDYTHLHFLITGCLYWRLVVGMDPSRWRLTYPMKLGFLAVGIPVGTLLGLGLTQTSTSVAPLFHTLADTHRGGALLWIASEMVTFVAMGIMLFQWMGADRRDAVRADRRADSALAERVARRQAGTADPRDASDVTLTRVTVVDGRLVMAPNDDPAAGAG